MKTDILEGLSDFFKALSDPTRLKLFRLLMFNDEDKLKVTDLAEKIGVSQPAITQHINILKDLKLINSNREQNRKFYFINKTKFKSYKRILNIMMDISNMRCTFKGKCAECPNSRFHKK
ncbi:MAG: metalloregulator ArsR/SmtB family transcription factor [Candidatus Lokiarchaeota archaeon]|nr:metalloregulator ArsR/SmtB family transcription factor [Candidatus Lokiarchaeota archaeon]